jgi:hypothetical protein
MQSVCVLAVYTVCITDCNDYENWHKTCVEHLNCKLYYRQLHLKYWCDLARYWLQAVWGWQDIVETCSSVIICEIIVHLLVGVQNNKRCMVQGIEINKIPEVHSYMVGTKKVRKSRCKLSPIFVGFERKTEYIPKNFSLKIKFKKKSFLLGEGVPSVENFSLKN